MSVYWKSSYSMLYYFIETHYEMRLYHYNLLFSLGNTIEGLCFFASSKSIEQ